MKNHTQNLVEKLVPDLFVLLHLQVGDYHNASKLSCWPLSFTFYKGFFKNKKRSGTSLLPHVMHGFCKKTFILLYSINWPGFIVWLSLLRKILGNMYCNCLLTRLWRHEFWNSSCLSNQAVFPTCPKSHDKNLNILRTKRAFKMK